jgi:hypothetical protein
MYFLQTLRLLHDTIGLHIISKNRNEIAHVVAARLCYVRVSRGTGRGLGTQRPLGLFRRPRVRWARFRVSE